MTPRLSVCIATYNGSRLIGAQLKSILRQLGPDDEVVIVDDASSDDTIDVIEAFQEPRIKLVKSPVNRGHVRTFEASITMATGDVIFLSDQDDVWIPGRVRLMIDALSKSSLVATNWQLESGELPTRGRIRSRQDQDGFGNLIALALGRRAYFGCCMAFRRELTSIALPFPRSVEAHDHWLATVSIVMSSISHLETPTLVRTLHEGNLTPSGRRPFGLVIRSRIKLMHQVWVASERATAERLTRWRSK